MVGADTMNGKIMVAENTSGELIRYMVVQEYMDFGFKESNGIYQYRVVNLTGGILTDGNICARVGSGCEAENLKYQLERIEEVKVLGWEGK